MNDTAIPLYSRISLNRDFPEYNLRQGDIATFIATVPDPEGLEEGYILEIFNALGDSVDVVTVPKSAVSALHPGDIPSVRPLATVSTGTNANKRRAGYITIVDAKGRRVRVSRRRQLGRRSRKPLK